MDLDDGGVDHGELHIRIIRYSLEKPLENIGLHPVAIALEDRVPLAEKLGKVAPGLPVRAIQSTASTNSRLSPPLRPGSLGFPKQCRSIFAHWPSVITNRSIPSLNQLEMGIPILNRP
jgi:hypothetical protein